MSELHDKKEIIKTLIKRLHEGAHPEEIKEEFKNVIKDMTSAEIVEIEEELAVEGIPRKEVQRLCEVHPGLSDEDIKEEKALAPEGHPVQILMEEHTILLKLADELVSIAQKTKKADILNSVEEEMKQIKYIEENLKRSESHYLREENVLFPYLEKHGVTQPPVVMWTDHNQIRENKKVIYNIIEDRQTMVFKEFTERLEKNAQTLAEILLKHFFKENKILFPTALKVIEENEWKDIREEFDDIGYCSFTPEVQELITEEEKEIPAKLERDDLIPFETGQLTKDEIEAIFNALPVDITFVNKDDIVQYFSHTKERIFTRTKAIIGLKVQQCHPQKSIQLVNKVLEDLKSGRQDVAEFWINQKGRLIHIRYFPIYNKNGEYIGCIEVTQDVTDIKKLEGEKRLLYDI